MKETFPYEKPADQQAIPRAIQRFAFDKTIFLANEVLEAITLGEVKSTLDI